MNLNPLIKMFVDHNQKRFNKMMNEMKEETVSDDLEVFSDLPYESFDRTLLKLDLYRPKEYKGSLPIIIFVHGGGLFVGTPKMEKEIASKLARLGYLVFVLDYRLMNEASGMQEIGDISKGFLYVKEEASKYDGDLNKVYVIAESAGAYLSIYALAMNHSFALEQAIGYPKNDLDAKAFVGLSGMFYTTKKDLYGTFYKRAIYGPERKNKAFMQLMDPECKEVIEHLPISLLVSSENDFLKDYTLDYYEALKKADKNPTLIYYPENEELTHAFAAIKPHLKESDEVIAKIHDWFQTV